MQNNNHSEKKQDEKRKPVKADTDRQRREAEQFKRRYFDYYDDVKISVKEDW